MKFKKRSICRLALVCMATVLPGWTQKSPNQTNWMDYGGGVDALQYSPLQQINKKSVGQLTQAWFYSVPGVSARFSYSPTRPNRSRFATNSNAKTCTSGQYCSATARIAFASNPSSTATFWSVLTGRIRTVNPLCKTCLNTYIIFQNDTSFIHYQFLTEQNEKKKRWYFFLKII